ncbi:hypothetical protein Smic_81150 [Streptomyces microflavus]|uniref:Uncharacterized protein n=1 Tax=Streptomyces microflavus TaxID=1919 RepID=A0A7J0D4X4_STRMI|nr:hypothetical protein Smic_81150 [Streptomyces microflavus]
MRESRRDPIASIWAVMQVMASTVAARVSAPWAWTDVSTSSTALLVRRRAVRRAGRAATTAAARMATEEMTAMMISGAMGHALTLKPRLTPSFSSDALPGMPSAAEPV